MNFLLKLKDINTFVFDVDGVLTDSNLIVLENGRLLRQMNTRDGYAIKRAIKAGYRVAIITGGKSEGVVKRLEGLGVEDIFTGIEDKKEVLEDYLNSQEVSPDYVLYMGDDMPDYHAMRLIGMPACPHNACHEIVELSRYISPYKGGEGCVRDVIEKVMRLHNSWLDEVQQADEQKMRVQDDDN